MSKDIKIIPTSRQVIENKLLTTLDDSSGCVALLVNRIELETIILGLRYLGSPKAADMAEDLAKLHNAAFT